MLQPAGFVHRFLEFNRATLGEDRGTEQDKVKFFFLHCQKSQQHTPGHTTLHHDDRAFAVIQFQPCMHETGGS